MPGQQDRVQGENPGGVDQWGNPAGGNPQVPPPNVDIQTARHQHEIVLPNDMPPPVQKENLRPDGYHGDRLPVQHHVEFWVPRIQIMTPDRTTLAFD